MLMGPGWKIGQITGEDGCPGKYDDVLGAFALPGTDTDVAPTFLGGSNVGVSTNSDNADLATRVPDGASPARPSRRSTPRSD